MRFMFGYFFFCVVDWFNGTDPNLLENRMSKKTTTITQGTEIARKLSPASIIGENRKRPDEPKWIYRIAGVVNGYERSKENSAFGEYVRLIGEFQAIVFDTGEVFIGMAAFLPAGVAELYAARLDSNPGKAFNLLFDIGLAPDPRENPMPGQPPVKYIYIVRNPTNEHLDSPAHKLLISAPLPVGTKQIGNGDGTPRFPQLEE